MHLVGLPRSMHRPRAGWAAFVAWIVHTVALQAAEVPDVSSCNYCMHCHVGNTSTAPPTSTPPGPSRRILQQGKAESDAEQLSFQLPAGDAFLQQSKFLLAQTLKPPPDNKDTLPNCTVCSGCNTQLTNMSASSQFNGLTYQHETGASTAWLFKAAPPGQPDKQAVVKMYCVPLAKSQEPKARFARCKDSRVTRVVTLLLALQKLSEECGFTDIVTKVWLDHVNAVVPGIGYHVRWKGLWMEQAPGISIENLVRKGKPHRMNASALLDILHNKLNGTQVVRAALFDLLTSQCDRHAQNIFIDEMGQLKLIDNEVALQNSWLHCGFDSVLIPNTLKRHVVIFNTWKVPDWSNPYGFANPQLLLDYRCYLPEGKTELGTDYPPQVEQCLTRIANMTVQQVQDHYDIPELPALNLHTRATDMLTKGFEWAYMHGSPRNGPHKEYKLQPKCCKLQWVRRLSRYRCAHDWEVVNYSASNTRLFH